MEIEAEYQQSPLCHAEQTLHGDEKLQLTCFPHSLRGCQPPAGEIGTPQAGRCGTVHTPSVGSWHLFS